MKEQYLVDVCCMANTALPILHISKIHGGFKNHIIIWPLYNTKTVWLLIKINLT